MAEAFAALKSKKAVAAWLLKCNPDIFDVVSLFDDGETIDSWSVTETYRLDLVDEGQLAYLWVTGPKNASPIPGVWARGYTTGERRVGRWDSSYVVNPSDADKARTLLGLEMDPLPGVVPRSRLEKDRRFVKSEILRQPQMSNPLVLTPPEVDAIEDARSQLKEKWARR